MASKCHLVEIDLHRRGRHVLSVPSRRVRRGPGCNYLICVNRFPRRTRYELYPVPLRNKLPTIYIPLSQGDDDVRLSIQAAFEQVYEDGSYMQPVRYEEPCRPLLSAEDQAWATGCWQQYRAAHPEWFPPAAPDVGA